MARKRIVQLPLATGPTGTDVVPIVSSGSTKRVALSTLSTFFSTASGVVGPTGPTGAAAAYQGATAPASATTGATWLDTSSGRYHVRFDNLWVEVG